MSPGHINDSSQSGNVSPADSPTAGISIPPLNIIPGHIRQKASRAGMGDRQYSYDVTTGPSARVVPRSNPSPPPSLHTHNRHLSEGTTVVGDRTPPATANGGRNASISTLDTTQGFTSTNGMDTLGSNTSGGRRRHGHGHSHGHSHHHHPPLPVPVPSKPASMMSTTPSRRPVDGSRYIRVCTPHSLHQFRSDRDRKS